MDPVTLQNYPVYAGDAFSIVDAGHTLRWEVPHKHTHAQCTSHIDWDAHQRRATRSADMITYPDHGQGFLRPDPFDMLAMWLSSPHSLGSALHQAEP